MPLPVDATPDPDPLVELHPLVDPLRCSPCLARGDLCDFHLGVAAGLGATDLFDLDLTEDTAA